MKPQAPNRFFDMPFAQEGDYTIPKTYPDETTEGRTTLSEGFPEVTQLPVAKGGIAPNRWDFNGMYYMLSAFAFWAQSGGMMTWNSTLSYAPPAMVYYNGTIYICIKENGPESDLGASLRPTEDTAGEYWQTMLTFLSSSEGRIVSEGSRVTLSQDATGTGTFDSEGNVTVPTTVETASQLRTGRGITLSGDTTGTVTFDGSQDVTMETTTNTATALRTGRDIKLSGDVTGSISGDLFDGTGDVTIEATVDSSVAGAAFVSFGTIQSRSTNKSYTETQNGYLIVSVKANYYTNGMNLKIGSWSRTLLCKEFYGQCTDTAVFPVKAGTTWSTSAAGNPSGFGASAIYFLPSGT